MNGDPILHNIRAYDEDRKTLFNWAQPIENLKNKKKLDKEGVMSVQCDVHRWMQGYSGSKARLAPRGIATPGPHRIDFVGSDVFINSENGQSLDLGLCDDESIERVTMMCRQ